MHAQIQRFRQLLLATLPVLLLAYLYVGAKIYDAVSAVFGLPADVMRVVAFGGLAWFCFYPFVLLLLHLVLANPEREQLVEQNRLLDIFFAMPFWVGLVFVVELAPWFLGLDFIKLPFYPFYDHLRDQWLTYQHFAVIGLGGAYLLYVVVGIVVDTVRIRVSPIWLTIADSPGSLKGLRIVHISDIQFDRRTGSRRLRRYVRKVNNLEPHLVFFTGDLATLDKRDAALAARILGRIESKYGKYACLGDHDLHQGEQDIASGLKDNGIRLLSDKNQWIRIGREQLMVTSVTNAPGARANLDNLHFLMGQQPRGGIDIILAHQPSESIIELAAERGYHLFLAGHTHGGLVILRPFGIRTSLSRLQSPYYRGMRRVDGMVVSINSGLGFRRAPIRFRAPSEVSLIQVGLPPST